MGIVYELAEREGLADKPLEWKRQVPNKVGHWLYVDVGGWVQQTEVLESDNASGGNLTLFWPRGHGGPVFHVKVYDYSKILQDYLWYGPIPLPPEE